MRGAFAKAVNVYLAEPDATAKGLAEAAGKHFTTSQNWKNGVALPEPETARKIRDSIPAPWGARLYDAWLEDQTPDEVWTEIAVWRAMSKGGPPTDLAKAAQKAYDALPAPARTSLVVLLEMIAARPELARALHETAKSFATALLKPLGDQDAATG